MFADSIDALRLRWRLMLIGGNLDTSLAEVCKRLSALQSAAQQNLSSIKTAAGLPYLWEDLSSTTISAEISAAYDRLHEMALAWATPGQSLYQKADLLAKTIFGMDWMDAHRYYSNATEYDNWYEWEIGAPTLVVDIADLLYDQLNPDQLSRYMAAVEYFDSNPTMQQVHIKHKPPVTSTAANRSDKCKIALLRGILVKDQAKIKTAVDDLRPVFRYVTSGDGFYADGSYIQHTFPSGRSS